MLPKKKKVTKTKRKPSVKTDPFRVRPDRDWVAVFSVFILLNIVALGFHAYLFYQVSQGEFFSVTPTKSVEVNTVNRDRLQEVLETFSEKEERLLQRVSSPERVPSPR